MENQCQNLKKNPLSEEELIIRQNKKLQCENSFEDERHEIIHNNHNPRMIL